MKLMFVVALLVCCAATAKAQAITDIDILTFALNLECLEAEFYNYAASGKGIGEELLGRAPSLTKGGQAVSNLADYKDTAIEIAKQEKDHVAFLRSAGITAPCPAIDIGASFTGLFSVATEGKVAKFNAYDSVESFLLASFVFEDVGVTAYLGAAPLIKTPAFLVAGARIAAVEAYHAGAIRTALGEYAKMMKYGSLNVGQVANAISAARDAVGNSTAETPLIVDGKLRVSAATEDSSLAYTRTAAQVLRIVYLGTKDMMGMYSKGGFYPVGLTGNITSTP